MIHAFSLTRQHLTLPQIWRFKLRDPIITITLIEVVEVPTLALEEEGVEASQLVAEALLSKSTTQEATKTIVLSVRFVDAPVTLLFGAETVLITPIRVMMFHMPSLSFQSQTPVEENG